MMYVTKNRVKINNDHLRTARLLAVKVCGYSYGFGVSEFRNICLVKDRISYNEFRFSDSVRLTSRNFDATILNNFPEAYNNTGSSRLHPLDRFLKTFDFFLEHEEEIFGSADEPRFFDIAGSIFSDTDILISFDILQGKRKHTMDDEVLSFINGIPGIEEINQERITFDFLISRNDYFRAIKKAMKTMSKREAVELAARNFFGVSPDEDSDEDFF